MADVLDMASLIARNEPLAQVVATPELPPCWIVGGAVRDALVGRRVTDVDLAVDGDAKAAAQALHRRLGGDIFSLSDRFGTWRVLPDAGEWQIDLTALRGDSIEADLALRDFTVNAMAIALGDPSQLIDPLGGADDIADKRLRVLGASAYADDPLRPLRLPRFAAALEFEPDAETLRLTREHAAAVNDAAPERIFAELRELMRAPGVLRGLELLELCGLTAVLLPELLELRGVEQSVYHHLDAYDHTIEVLEQLLAFEQAPAEIFGEDATDLVEQLERPLADELTRGEALRWAALLHDIAKRETRSVFENGRVGFPGHDRRGAEIVRVICGRLNTSDKFAQYVAALTRHHLRLGFLVDAQPLSKRAEHAYLRICEPVEVEVGVLSVADRTATRGRKSEQAIAAHLELAAELNRAALAWRANADQPPLVRGDVLAEALGIEPGPQLGELLDEIAEARYAGEIADEAGAIRLAQRRIQN
ncbi:MAG: HD domain-containing protein [Solirubrobacterales bacterium]